MINRDLVNVREFALVGEDERGQTASFKLPREQSDFIYITRKAGSKAGNTYHTGKHAGTCPKTFLLLHGEIELGYRKVGAEQAYYEQIKAPMLIEVQPYVTHNMTMLKDCLILECNGFADIEDDRFREDV